MNRAPIGIFDSGYGGLTVLKEIEARLPGYDYIYLGDNARTPYGTRSFDSVYAYTLQAVQWLFEQGCPLVILACNTASAKALRTIQQNDLSRIAPGRRALGVIRPVTEIIGSMSTSGHVGIFATSGTARSRSYPIEIAKFFPRLTVHMEACPLWVPLVENNEIDTEGADFFVRKHIAALLERAPLIDAVVLGCTHYPLLLDTIRRHLPESVAIIVQGAIVAKSLADYLQRHPEIDSRCTRNGDRRFYTTDSAKDFDCMGMRFYGHMCRSTKVCIDAPTVYSS
jgi:glutamate racemase